jgi:anti-sigma regulatory factor (Ser/Thr protein kinase)
MTHQHFELDRTAGARGLAQMRAETREYLHSVGMHNMAVEEVVLAVGEALSNAVEHSGPSNFAPVDVEIDLVDDELMIDIADHGHWRNRPPRPDGGRGLGIMRAVMDHVAIDAKPTGTCVHLRKRLPRCARAPHRVDPDV